MAEMQAESAGHDEPTRGMMSHEGLGTNIEIMRPTSGCIPIAWTLHANHLLTAICQFLSLIHN